MANPIRCEASVSASVKCNTPLKFDFMTEMWNHDLNGTAPSAFTDHTVIVPAGTERPRNFIEELMDETAGKYLSARTKYQPLVRKLTDMEFAGLFRVVMEERESRLLTLMVTHPFLRNDIMDQLFPKRETIKDAADLEVIDPKKWGTTI